MDLDQRIAQFENMAQADPGNEMAHFSLGGAYTEAKRFKDAADAYLRCIKASPDMSKAYQMAGAALIQADDAAKAAETLTKGYQVAVLQGDLMPRNAIEKLLKQLGKPIPEVAGAPAPAAPAAPGAPGSFMCQQSGKTGTQMPKPPFRGPVGKWIHENISSETFGQWILQGTKVINELRLDLSRDEDAETYDRYMREFLGIDQALYEQLRSGTNATNAR